ncbi:MAG: histidinol dehydrogenase [Myxococcota bacterium]
MLRVLRAGASDDDAAISALARRAPAGDAAGDAAVEARVREILDDVRARGDFAVREWTLRIEGRRLERFEVDLGGGDDTTPPVRAAIEAAATRIRAFHQREASAYTSFEIDQGGVRVGLRVAPLARVGVYVPGGKARYPSTVLMAAIPARVAGVPDVVVVTPSPSPEVLFAARVAGVSRVLALGGAQAIGALAYGTASVPRVDTIVGPGNAWVTCAKRLVAFEVGIDFLAGPTEVLVIADDAADARLIAADLLAQAEHDEAARPILVTPSAELAARVAAEVERQLADLPRRAIARVAVDGGAAIVVETIDDAVALANSIAPEHVEVHARDARAIAARISKAGAIFIGAYSPEPAGDYMAGPSHVLPTGGAARYASPLGVSNFLKRTSTIEYTREALAAQAADIGRLAEVEGLSAHARAVAARMT